MTTIDDHNMDLNEHPADGLIEDYLNAPEEDAFGDLRLHLAGCRHCRRRVELTAMLRDQGHWLDSDAAEADPRIAELVAGRMDSARASRLRQEIKRDPAALRAALHYASHARAMRGITAAEPRERSTRSIALARLKSWLNFEAPIWQVAPALAVVMTVALLAFNRFYPAEQGGQAEIVVFQDNPVLQFASHESQPGIGFFSQQGANAVPFDGMMIELLADDRLRLSWPEIPGVNGYNLKLQVFRDGETRVLARQTSSSNMVELKFDEALSQHRYEWVLTGNTSDKRSFQADGGFVLFRD